jgi:hypothetical protein
MIIVWEAKFYTSTKQGKFVGMYILTFKFLDRQEHQFMDCMVVSISKM